MQVCEAGAQAILGGLSQKGLDDRVGAWNVCSCFTDIVYGASKLYK